MFADYLIVYISNNFEKLELHSVFKNKPHRHNTANKNRNNIHIYIIYIYNVLQQKLP